MTDFIYWRKKLTLLVSCVCDSLKKDVAERPDYAGLLEHPFITRETVDNDEVQSFVRSNLLEFAREFGLDFDAQS